MDKGSEITIEPLGREHLRDTFDCDKPPLDDYLKRFARQSHELGIAKTFVAVRKPDLTVLGYYSLCMGNVTCANFPPEEVKRLPRHPVPVVHLARLARDRRVRGQGMGELLLASALKKAWQVSENVAAYAVEVIAKDEKAKKFYLKYGFKSLMDDQLHMYLSMKTIAKLPF